MLRIVKQYVGKKLHIFHAPEKPTNQEFNFDAIGNDVIFFCKFHCTHAKESKTVCWQEIAYFSCTCKNPQIRNLTLTSLVMMLNVKVQTVFSFKGQYFHE